jgi:hypothetical protein
MRASKRQLYSDAAEQEGLRLPINADENTSNAAAESP